MADIDLKTETPDTSLPTTGFLFGADSQAAASPSVYSTQTVATTLLGSTSLTGATITTSQPVLNMSQTWNASGVTFTGLRFNAATGSSAGSAAASLLMDLQLEGTSQFILGKSGTFALRNQFQVNQIEVFETGAAAMARTAADRNIIIVATDNAGLNLSTTNTVNWASGLPSFSGSSADLILSRRGPANLRLGAADAAAPVAQTLSVQSVVAGTTDTAGANLTITGSQGTGTGAGGSIIFQVAPAGSSGTAQNALATTFQVNGNGGVTGQDGATANTLALRNGANAQTFNVYNTFTSSTNFERFRIFAQSAAAVLIGTEKGSGGGTARALELQTDATSRLTLDTVGSAQIVTALTVATLPATPLTGMIARVTDALAPAVGVTVAAGGAAQALCWYNGANWTVIGV